MGKSKLKYEHRLLSRNISHKDFPSPDINSSRNGNSMVMKMTLELLKEYGITMADIQQTFKAWTETLEETVSVGDGHEVAIPYVGRFGHVHERSMSVYLKGAPPWLKHNFRIQKVSAANWMEIFMDPQRSAQLLWFLRNRRTLLRIEDIVKATRYGITAVEQIDLESRAQQNLAINDSGIQGLDLEGQGE